MTCLSHTNPAFSGTSLDIYRAEGHHTPILNKQDATVWAGSVAGPIERENKVLSPLGVLEEKAEGF